MESGKVLKERVENFLNNGGTIEQFAILYTHDNDCTIQEFVDAYYYSLNEGGSIFDKIGRAIENLWKAIVGFFTGFGDFIGSIIQAIWDAVASICEAIGNIVSGIVNGILNGLSSILEFLFVPEHNPFEDLSTKINSKFGFVSQIGQLISNLLGFNNYGNSVPNFEITYYNTSVSIIDFSIFLQYRDWIHGIILAIAWTIFILKTYKKLPNIIGGYGE